MIRVFDSPEYLGTGQNIYSVTLIPNFLSSRFFNLYSRRIACLGCRLKLAAQPRAQVCHNAKSEVSLCHRNLL